MFLNIGTYHIINWQESSLWIIIGYVNVIGTVYKNVISIHYTIIYKVYVL